MNLERHRIKGGDMGKSLMKGKNWLYIGRTFTLICICIRFELVGAVCCL